MNSQLLTTYNIKQQIMKLFNYNTFKLFLKMQLYIFL